MISFEEMVEGWETIQPDSCHVYFQPPSQYRVLVCRMNQNLDIDDVLYQSPIGPIMALDVLYGYTVEIERSGVDFFAHKTGFTQKSLIASLRRAGFLRVYSGTGNLEVQAIAFHNQPTEQVMALFNLPLSD